MEHNCDKLPSDISIIQVDENPSVWAIYKISTLEEIENILHCPYCGAKL